MNRKMTVSLILGLAVSVPALWFTFRHIPVRSLTDYLAEINYFWIFPSLAAILASIGLRACRWRIIVSAVTPIGFWSAYHPLIISFMTNCLLPGRIGELARPLVLNRRDNVPFSAGLGTVAAERLLDLLTLLMLMIVVMASIQMAPDLEIEFQGFHLTRDTLKTIETNMIRMSVILIIGVLLFIMDRTRSLIRRCIETGPDLLIFAPKSFRERLHRKIALPLCEIVDHAASGFRMVRSVPKLTACFSLSILAWAVNAFAFYLFSLGCPNLEISYFNMFAVMILICFFIALPSVPGYWGLWEAAGVFALSVFGIAQREAAGFTLANHAVQVFSVILLGMISAFLTGVRLTQLKTPEADGV